MNYLAHAWLARHHDDAILGAILGDFVRGQAALADWPPMVRDEILLHRQIDGYTDAHPAVAAARALFGDGLRRYAGIVLDVYFDHRLARDWSRWEAQPLDTFTSRVYRILAGYRARLPERLKAIAPLMARHDWLGSYRARGSVDNVVRGISTRLSRNGERLLACLPVLAANEAAVDAAFEMFFPALIEASHAMRATQQQL